MCSCVEGKLSQIDDFPKLKDVIPYDLDTIVCKYIDLDKPDAFETTLRLTCIDEQGISEWLKRFQEYSLTTLRVAQTYASLGNRLLFKRIYRCQHKTYQTDEKANSKRSSKNTNCGFSLTVSIKQFTDKTISKDPHLVTHPTCVTIKFCHNHPLTVAEVLRHRDVAPETRYKFQQLYKAGYNPSAALEAHKFDLSLEKSEEHLASILNDRAYMPDIHWCYRLFYQMARKESAGVDGGKQKRQMIINLNKHVANLNQQFGGNCVCIDTIGDDFCVAICTPLMKRVHVMIPQSGETVFVDSSGGNVLEGYHVYTLMIHSLVGPLPLGIVITMSNLEPTLLFGLHLLKSLLPENAFAMRGVEVGPQEFLAEDQASLKVALQKSFPGSSVEACQHNVLWTLWRWLWDETNNIALVDRARAFYTVKEMMFSETEDKYWGCVEALNGSSLALQYNNYMAFVQQMDYQRDEWATSFRKSRLFHGQTTDDMVANAMRIFKDKMICKITMFNLCQLIDFLCTRFDAYFRYRLEAASENRTESLSCLQHFPKPSSIDLPWISEIYPESFDVRSETGPTLHYTVNTTLFACTCTDGKDGGVCKHVIFVLVKYNLTPFEFPPINDPKQCEALYEVAHGSKSTEDACKFSFGDDLDENSGNIPKLEIPIGLETEIAKMACMTKLEPHYQSSDETVKYLSESLSEMFGEIHSNLQIYPEHYQSPVAAFINAYKSLNTDQSKINALENFGRVCATLNSQSMTSQAVHYDNECISLTTPVITVSVGGRRGRPLGSRVKKDSTKRKLEGQAEENSSSLPKRSADSSMHECTVQDVPVAGFNAPVEQEQREEFIYIVAQ